MAALCDCVHAVHDGGVAGEIDRFAAEVLHVRLALSGCGEGPIAMLQLAVDIYVYELKEGRQEKVDRLDAHMRKALRKPVNS